MLIDLDRVDLPPNILKSSRVLPNKVLAIRILGRLSALIGSSISRIKPSSTENNFEILQRMLIRNR